MNREFPQTHAQEKNISGKVSRELVHFLENIDEPIIMIDVTDGSAVYYYHFDGLGSVVALSNTNSEVVETYSYDVFGEPTIRDANGDEIADSNFGNPYMFTGRRIDPETDNYYYRARYYKPSIGRFLQPDPIGYSDGLNM